MLNVFFSHVRLIFILPLACMLLTACDSGVSGKYSDQTGATTIVFDGDGNAVHRSIIGTNEVKYTVEGNKVILQGGGKLQLTIQDDGSLTSGNGSRYVKVQN